MTGFEPQPVTASGAAGISEFVRAACSQHIGRIGTLPGPMLDDYNQIVRDSRTERSFPRVYMRKHL